MAEQLGVFSRLRRFLFGEPQTYVMGPRPTVNYEPPDDTEPVVVAARGDLYDLHLIPHFRWSSSEMPFDLLEQRSRLYLQNARGTLLQRIWSVCRQLDPTDPAAAEIAINNLPSVRDGLCYDDELGAIQCTVSVRALLDPRLRELLLPFHQRGIELDQEHQLDVQRMGHQQAIGRQRADQVEELVQRWLAVIKELEQLTTLGRDERQFLLPFAARIVDSDFASVMQHTSLARQERATELVDVLRQASSNHERVGLFEFADAYDKALRTFSRQMGLNPFSWLLSDFGGRESTRQENE